MYLWTSVLHTNVRFELVCTFIPRKMSHSVSGSVLQLEEENTNQINRNRCTWFSKTRPKPSKKCSTIHLQKTGKRNPSPPSESPVFFKHQKIPGALSFKIPGVVVFHRAKNFFSPSPLNSVEVKFGGMVLVLSMMVEIAAKSINAHVWFIAYYSDYYCFLI